MLKRGDKSELVYRLQRKLQAMGFLTEAVIQTGAGNFGPATQKAVRAYFTTLAESGDVKLEHWRALFPYFNSLHNFNGDASWVHSLEGHAGKAYWPKGKSGITLDPGCDLGYVDASVFREAYKFILTDNQMAECLNTIQKRIRGNAAKEFLEDNVILQSIRISRDEADDIFPVVASHYWAEIVKRFPLIEKAACPPSVQSVLLSLAYNRGANNPDLAKLAAPIHANDWVTVACMVGEMQQDHPQKGIRKRRKQESDYIKSELEK